MSERDTSRDWHQHWDDGRGCHLCDYEDRIASLEDEVKLQTDLATFGVEECKRLEMHAASCRAYLDQAIAIMDPGRALYTDEATDLVRAARKVLGE